MPKLIIYIYKWYFRYIYT